MSRIPYNSYILPSFTRSPEEVIALIHERKKQRNMKKRIDIDPDIIGEVNEYLEDVNKNRIDILKQSYGGSLNISISCMADKKKLLWINYLPCYIEDNNHICGTACSYARAFTEDSIREKMKEIADTHDIAFYFRGCSFGNTQRMSLMFRIEPEIKSLFL